MKLWIVAVSLCLSLSGVALAEESAEQVDPSIAQGRAMTKLFYNGELGKVYQLFTAEMRSTMTMEQFRQSRRQVSEMLGVEKTLHDERVEKRDGGYLVYMREASFEKVPDRFRLIWAMRDGQVGGFFVRPVDDELITPKADG